MTSLKVMRANPITSPIVASVQEAFKRSVLWNSTKDPVMLTTQPDFDLLAGNS